MVGFSCTCYYCMPILNANSQMTLKYKEYEKICLLFVFTAKQILNCENFDMENSNNNKYFLLKMVAKMQIEK